MMTSIVIQSYFTMLVSVGIVSFIIFICGLILLLKKPTQQDNNPVQSKPSTHALASQYDETKPPDITAIAGDDKLATQLDLARAYIETGKHKLAKNILTIVLAQGSAIQQQEAKQLLSTL